MESLYPSTSSPTPGPASASDPPKNISTRSIPPPPLYDPSSSDDDDDDDFDHPLYPNRALHLPTPPSSPKPALTATSPPPSRSRSPQRRPRITQTPHSPHTSPLVLSESSHSTTSSSSVNDTPSSSPSSTPSSSTPASPRAPSNISPPPPFSNSAPGPSASSSSSTPPASVQDIQHRIRLISRDPNLSESEKNRQRQAILSQPFQQRRKKEAMAFSAEMHRQRHLVTYSDIVDPDTGAKLPGCEHYPRNCKIKAGCCGLWVVCRHCHDDPSMDHAINRFDTEQVMCVFCFTVQPVSRRCVNVQCQKEFARYFCEKCKFYDNTPGKDIYHCDKCGICRVGKGIGVDNFHCDRCDACVSVDYSATHRCLKKSLDADCPICGIYLFTSTKPVVFMRCGHTMHSHCFDVYTAENYTCPLCQKALTNMRSYYAQIDEAMKEDVMPSEHRNRVSEILCHDCDMRSETPFHFLYLKCQMANCGSYNTRILRTYVKDSPNDSPNDVAASAANAASGSGEEHQTAEAEESNDGNVDSGDESSTGDNESTG